MSIGIGQIILIVILFILLFGDLPKLLKIFSKYLQKLQNKINNSKEITKIKTNNLSDFIKELIFFSNYIFHPIQCLIKYIIDHLDDFFQQTIKI